MKRETFWTAMAATFAGVPALAAGPIPLPVLTPAQTGPLFQTVAAAYAFRPLEPASELIHSYAMTLGVEGTLADGGPVGGALGTSVPAIPAAGLTLALQYRGGVGIELGVIPPVPFNGATLGIASGDVKWTFAKLSSNGVPLSFAARAGYSYCDLNYGQTVSGVNVVADFGTHVAGASLAVSLQTPYFEPYIGGGGIAYASGISAAGSTVIFGSSFPVGTVAAYGTGYGFVGTLGFQFKYDFAALTAEYDNISGINTVSLKIAFRSQ